MNLSGSVSGENKGKKKPTKLIDIIKCKVITFLEDFLQSVMLCNRNPNPVNTLKWLRGPYNFWFFKLSWSEPEFSFQCIFYAYKNIVSSPTIKKCDS